jgi:hypothetical protein
VAAACEGLPPAPGARRHQCWFVLPTLRSLRAWATKRLQNMGKLSRPKPERGRKRWRALAAPSPPSASRSYNWRAPSANAAGIFRKDRQASDMDIFQDGKNVPATLAAWSRLGTPQARAAPLEPRGARAARCRGGGPEGACARRPGGRLGAARGAAAAEPRPSCPVGAAPTPAAEPRPPVPAWATGQPTFSRASSWAGATSGTNISTQCRR